MEINTTSHADPKHVPILNAHPVPPRHKQKDIPYTQVRARIRWETGEETIPCHAFAYSGQLVLIELLDPRADNLGYWLHTNDIQRHKVK